MIAVTALGASGFAIPAPAQAVAPPSIDSAALGAAAALNAKGGPPDPTVQRTMCAAPILSGPDSQNLSPSQRFPDLPQAWRISRGAGQRVAVIDTGVARHPRLRNLQPGGDFVSSSDGTVDCDGHGTLIAGLIAAQPSPHDAFSGIAPDASILSIRALSLAYRAANDANSTVPGQIPYGYGSATTLAASVMRAVDKGATVIDIPVGLCTAAGEPTADGALGAAVKYAADRNVVVVAATADVRADSECPEQNAGSGWGAVQSVASPAWFGRDVLAVASTDPDGSVSPFSLHGPWIGVAAPGRNVVSLDTEPGGTGLVNAVQGEAGAESIEGTSFSSAYVAGLAALVRTRFPALTAAQVIERIEHTAKHPGPGRDDAVGNGVIDPLAALTADATPRSGHAAIAPRILGAASVAVLVVLGVATSIRLRRRRATRP